MYANAFERLGKAIAANGIRWQIESPDHMPAYPEGNPKVDVSVEDALFSVAEPSAIGASVRVDWRSRQSLCYIATGTTLGYAVILGRGKNNLLYIGETCRIKQISIQIRGDNNIVAIGPGTTIENATIKCGPRGRMVLVGEDGMISSNVQIETAPDALTFDAETGVAVHAAADIIVQSHVWIGNGARMAGGSGIGRGGILGQLSVLQDVVEPHSVYAGVPARKLRDNVVWSRTTRIDDVPAEYFPVAADAQASA
jgi:acetyltransferase-like isoleucine patch superfamily enzyme